MRSRNQLETARRARNDGKNQIARENKNVAGTSMRSYALKNQNGPLLFHMLASQHK